MYSQVSNIPPRRSSLFNLTGSSESRKRVLAACRFSVTGKKKHEKERID